MCLVCLSAPLSLSVKGVGSYGVGQGFPHILKLEVSFLFSETTSLRSTLSFWMQCALSKRVEVPWYYRVLSLCCLQRWSLQVGFLVSWDGADSSEPPKLYTVYATVVVDICTVVKSVFSRSEMSLLWSWTKCRKLIGKFRNALVSNRLVIYKYGKMFGASGSIWDRKRERRRHFWYKHLDTIYARLKTSPRKSMVRLTQQTDPPAFSSRIARKLLNLHPYKKSVCCELCNTDRQARLASFRKTVQQLMAFLLYSLYISC
jgi:hypothetical protein